MTPITTLLLRSLLDKRLRDKPHELESMLLTKPGLLGLSADEVRFEIRGPA